MPVATAWRYHRSTDAMRKKAVAASQCQAHRGKLRVTIGCAVTLGPAATPAMSAQEDK